MRINICDTRLYFDVDGEGLAPDGPAMREKPTLICLHGGPGADHTMFKPRMSALTDLAQVIYLDHRGCGRSDEGAPEDWTLATWADDLAAFCDALEIARPILLGVSFGGFVAQAFEARHPGRARALALVSTAAKFDFDVMISGFEARGGARARDAAAAYWLNPTVPTRRAYAETCLPLYWSTTPDTSDMMARIILRDGPALKFNGPKNEMGAMDHRAALAACRAPVLVMAGADDPLTPPAFAREIADSAPNARLIVHEGASHGLFEDKPEALDDLRAFIDGL